MNRLSILHKSAFFKTILNNFLCLETIGTIDLVQDEQLSKNNIWTHLTNNTLQFTN